MGCNQLLLLGTLGHKNGMENLDEWVQTLDPRLGYLQ